MKEIGPISRKLRFFRPGHPSHGLLKHANNLGRATLVYEFSVMDPPSEIDVPIPATSSAVAGKDKPENTG